MKKVIVFICCMLFLPIHTTLAEEQCKELPLKEKKELLTKIALEYEIPPEILKTIALLETNMTQCQNGKPLISNDGGIGMMQITATDIKADKTRLMYDTEYNIRVAAETLLSKWKMQQNGRIPKMNTGDPNILENWYFAVLAYNGLSLQNDPSLYPNQTYQERFFQELEKYNGVTLGKFPAFEIEYEEGIMYFPKKHYVMQDKVTVSSQMFKPGDLAIVENDTTYANLREAPDVTSKLKEKLPLYTLLEIKSGPYIETSNDFNHFVMYEVEGANVHGYIASSNIKPVQVIPETAPVSAQKIWSFQLATDIVYDSISNDNIYIVDNNGKKAQTSARIKDHVLEVSPLNPLEQGNTYTLVLQHVRSADDILATPVAIPFFVEPASAEQVHVVINNQLQTFAQPPVIEQNRTLVPMRGIFEALGANVEWNNETKTVTAHKLNTTVILQANNREATVNGNVLTLDVPASIINGATMVPLRFVSEALAANVTWDAAHKTVIIHTYNAAQDNNIVKLLN